MLKKWLQDPLLHFLLIGAGLFLLYGLQADDAGEEPHRIVISESDIDRIINLWQRKWQRLPTQQELQGLIQQQVREEILYREALAMGLDKDDSVVRRRMAQKMEFISNDLATLAEPSDAQLKAYLDAHTEKFVLPGRISFAQIYFNADKRGEHVQDNASALMQQLQQSPADTDISTAGDPFLGGYEFNDLTEYLVARQFGKEFAQQLFRLPVGHWIGPVKSGYGLHLVHIKSRSDAVPRELEQVRDKVREEWQVEQRHKANEALFDELLKRYDIVIEQPASAVTQAVSRK